LVNAERQADFKREFGETLAASVVVCHKSKQACPFFSGKAFTVVFVDAVWVLAAKDFGGLVDGEAMALAPLHDKARRAVWVVIMGVFVSCHIGILPFSEKNKRFFLQCFPVSVIIGKDRNMKAEIVINMGALSTESMRVVLAAAEAWGCSPGAAAVRLIEELDSLRGELAAEKDGKEGGSDEG
jgi:hypothetical protein